MVGFPGRHGDRRTRLAASSRAGYLAFRRVERQQALIERLRAASGRFRMKKPADVRHDRAGGVSLVPTRDANRPELDPTEVAALMSSLAALGRLR